MAAQRLGQILVRSGLLDETGLRHAEAEHQQYGGSLGDHLVRLQLITEETLIRALSTQHQLPAVALDPPRLDPNTVRMVPQQICQNYRLICFRLVAAERAIDVALADPSRGDGIQHVQHATGYAVRKYIAAPSAIDHAIHLFFAGSRVHQLPPTPVQPQQRQPQPMVPPLPAPPTMVGHAGPANRAPTGNMTGEQFHITMDLPTVDPSTAAKAKPGSEDRLAAMESMLVKDIGLLRQLLTLLVRKGVLSADEINRLLKDA